MPHWLIKSAIHRGLSVLPWRQRWNEFFQARIGSLDLSPGAFEAKLNACRRYVADFRRFCPGSRGDFSALELGTGWYPILPIGLYLCGASQIHSFDIEPLLRRPRLKLLLNYFCDYDRVGKLAQFLPALKPERLELVRAILRNIETASPASLLERLNIHCLVRDAQNTGLPAGSIDLFVSHVVLEYIPAAVQQNLFAEFQRLASSNAAMIHFIDLKDQFARFDHSITPFNFLRYSARAWQRLDSPLIPQTRLRISDYRKLMKDAGFTIVSEDDTRAQPEMLARVPLAPEFKNYSPEDLLVLESWVVACLSPSPPVGERAG